MSNSRTLSDFVGSSGTPTFSSNTTFSANVAVTGSATLANTLAVTGVSNFTNAIVVGSSNTTFTDKRMLIDTGTNMHAVSALSNTYSYATLEVINTDTAATRFFQVFRTARGTGTIGSITGDTSGTGTTYNTTSDYRLKTNVQPITDGKERVLKLQPVRHGWTSNNEVVVDGFLAHQAQESGFEYAVAGEKDGDVMQSMDYGRISPAIVAALHDAFAEIAELKKRIEELENK